MFLKFILSATVYVVTATGASGQTPPASLWPMKSSVQDVRRVFGAGRMESENVVTYDENGMELRIYYSKRGCGDKTGPSENSVIEIQVTPKKPGSLNDAITDFGAFERRRIPDNRYLYYDRGRGIIVLSKTTQSAELVEKMYFLPADLSNLGCVLDDFGDSSGLALLEDNGLLESKIKRFDFPSENVGIYFGEDSKRSKKSLIDDFKKALEKRPNGIGLVIIFMGKDESDAVTAERRLQVINMLKVTSVDCKRVTISDAGRGGAASVSFSVVPASAIQKPYVTLCDQ